MHGHAAAPHVLRPSGFEGCLAPIYTAIREAITLTPVSRNAARPRQATCFEALQCVGMLAVALGPLWRPYAQALVEPMVLTGISEVLVTSLTQVRVAASWAVVWPRLGCARRLGGRGWGPGCCTRVGWAVPLQPLEAGRQLVETCLSCPRAG